MKVLGIEDFCYTHFNAFGRALSKIYRGVDKDMEAANMKIHHEVYLSIIGFLTLVTTFIPITVLSLKLLGIISLDLKFSLLSILPPIMMLNLGALAPKVLASNRISGLKTEIPYASMYISVMTSGGLSPYASLLKLRKMNLLPKLKGEITRIQGLVYSRGLDPVSAMERAAKVVKVKEYKDLLLGYASTLRTGGDVLHYLFSQTEARFRDMATRIKSMGETMSMLMETYLIVGVLGALGLYMVFVVGISLPGAGMGSLTPGTFFIFSFILLPVMSLFFIYFADVAQTHYPTSYWKTYTVFLATLPVGIFMITQMVIPFFLPKFPVFTPLKSLVLLLHSAMSLEPGSEAALGLALSLIVATVPAAIFDMLHSRNQEGVQRGIISFLRDLVETRKTGLSPERCIQMLSKKEYGKFSKHLKQISSKLSWGFSLRDIYEYFSKNVKSWLSLINMYLLIDAIEVGGGTEESLESLADFAELTQSLENEKKGLLMPLIFVPYFGAVLLTATTVMFLTFFTGMGASIPKVALYRTLLTPLVLHSFIIGLVSGKITSGRVSGGFKHALFLVGISIVGMWMTTQLQGFGIFGVVGG